MIPLPSRLLEAKVWVWAVREVERMEVNLSWLVQFKSPISMSITSWGDAKPTDGVTGVARSAGSSSENWLYADARSPLGRFQEWAVAARCKTGRGPISLSPKARACPSGTKSYGME